MSATNFFGKLFPDLDAAEFQSSLWPDHLYSAHGDVSRLPTPLCDPLLKSIDGLAANYRGRVSFGNAKTGSRTVAVEHICPDMLIKMGLSLYLPEIERMISGMSELLRDVESQLSVPPGCARIGAFIAPDENGVTCHMDAEEVFSIQLIGEKRFYISKQPGLEQPFGMQFNPGDVTYEDMYPQATDGFPDPETAEFDCVEMKPGSVLFMPRGTWHRTETSGLSLSVSIILRPPSAFESVLDALRSRLLQDSAWRRPLHGAWGQSSGQEAADKQLRLLIDKLPEAARELSIQDVRQTAYSESDRLANIGPASRFQVKPESTLKLSLQGQSMQARVTAKDSDGRQFETMQLDVPPPMIGVFQWLSQSRHAFSLETLSKAHPGLSVEQHLRILQALVKGGYLKPLWYRPLSRD